MDLNPLPILVYQQIVRENLEWINEMYRENAVSKKIIEQFPNDNVLRQYCEYFIRDNNNVIEIECMRDIEHARRQIDELKRIFGR